MSPPVLEFASAKPSADLLAVPPIAELLRLFVGKGDGWAHPAGGRNSPAQHRHHGEAADFLDRFADETLQGVILDQTSNADSWKVKDVAAKKIVPGGLAICCGWNSNGLGKKRGFELIHVLDARHGGDHADIIVTVEIKVPYQAADDFSDDDLTALRSQGQGDAVRRKIRCPKAERIRKRRTASAMPNLADLPSEISTAQVAKVLGVSKDTVLKLKAEGLLEYRNTAPPSSSRPVFAFSLPSVLAVRTTYQTDEPILRRKPDPPRRRGKSAGKYKHLRLSDD